MFKTVHGDQTGEQYFTIGRTYTTNALVSTPGSLLLKQRKIWLALSLALDTIQLTCGEKHNAESIQTPRSIQDDTVGSALAFNR